jgi:phosphoribosyl 1,2-cyclic phosphodiesterase
MLVELIILGSGSSSGTPRPICFLDPDSKCEVCKDAVSGQPHESKNWRGNPSMMVRATHADGRVRNIQFDIGKTYQQAVITWFPIHDIPCKLDAVVLTHGHADAILGLDDIRSLQYFDPKCNHNVLLSLSPH